MKFKQINWGLILVIIGTAIFWVVVIFALAGCTVIWTDDVFFADVLNSRIMSNPRIIIEPNYLEAGADLSTKKNAKITVVTPAGVGVGTSE